MKKRFERLMEENKELIKKLALEKELEVLNRLPKEMDNPEFKIGYVVNMLWVITRSIVNYLQYAIECKPELKDKATSFRNKLGIDLFPFYVYKPELALARNKFLENVDKLKQEYSFFKEFADKMDDFEYILGSKFLEVYYNKQDSALDTPKFTENAKAYFHLTQFCRELSKKKGGKDNAKKIMQDLASPNKETRQKAVSIFFDNQGYLKYGDMLDELRFKNNYIKELILNKYEESLQMIAIMAGYFQLGNFSHPRMEQMSHMISGQNDKDESLKLSLALFKRCVNYLDKTSVNKTESTISEYFYFKDASPTSLALFFSLMYIDYCLKNFYKLSKEFDKIIDSIDFKKFGLQDSFKKDFIGTIAKAREERDRG
ncbi:hypothetical protein JW707_02940 [Candidatus Woesearchaeota archaeon]|nr:hypothetical protein [Candidatus Woesearchaeota archaeon]